MHCHVRSGDMLKLVVPYTAKTYARALVMPNTDPPVCTAADVRRYREEILEAVPPGVSFEPLMTIKLTPSTTPAMIRKARQAGAIAAKLYPSGATTNSHGGITNLIDPGLKAVFAEMCDVGMVLCVHAELPGAPVLEREYAYVRLIEQHVRRRFPVKIVIEHVSSAATVQYICHRHIIAPGSMAGTITPQHLRHTVDDILNHDGKLDPHRFCYPVYKQRHDREALVEVATGGSPCFFAGDDSAPHPIVAKHSASPPPGCFCAPVSLETYAKVFEEQKALDKLEGFVSHHGADFYGLPRNKGTITLEQRISNPSVPAVVGSEIPIHVVPYRAGERLTWEWTETHLQP